MGRHSLCLCPLEKVRWWFSLYKFVIFEFLRLLSSLQLKFEEHPSLLDFSSLKQAPDWVIYQVLLPQGDTCQQVGWLKGSSKLAQFLYQSMCVCVIKMPLFCPWSNWTTMDTLCTHDVFVYFYLVFICAMPKEIWSLWEWQFHLLF